MGKKRRKLQPGDQGRELTHEEIWDDSALISSWNDALEEYKLYHSIHARGENVENVLKGAEMKEDNGDGDAYDMNGAAAEEGEVEDEQEAIQAENNSTADLSSLHVNGVAMKPSDVPEFGQGTGQSSRIPAVPQHLLGTVQDESLKNLMMAWYYAGYYTGLYEGQQRSGQTDQARQSNGGRTG